MAKFLKAAEGRTVDQEDGTPWPKKGMEAPDTLFIRRRLKDGDLIEAMPDEDDDAPVGDPAEEPVTQQADAPASKATKSKGAK